jgi:hypothetical protein
MSNAKRDGDRVGHDGPVGLRRAENAGGDDAGRPCQRQREVWTRTELFFGLARPNGPDITDAEWQKFVDDEVTPRFPAGLTVISTTGQWGSATGVVHERSRVLVLLHKSTLDSESGIEKIRERYKTQFEQDSIMRTDSYERVSF